MFQFIIVEILLGTCKKTLLPRPPIAETQLSIQIVTLDICAILSYPVRPLTGHFSNVMSTTLSDAQFSEFLTLACNMFLAANIVKRPLVDRLPLSALYNVCPWLVQKKATPLNQQWRGRRSFVITCLIAIHFPLFHTIKTIKTAPRGKTTPPKMETSHVSSEERFCLFQSIPFS